MEDLSRLQALGLFDARVPRYTSYPTAPVFSIASCLALQEECLSALDPADPVSVYVHIPFCERLCWFCAYRTQGTRTLSPVEHYLDTLLAELALLRAALPVGIRMGRLHWGGGTPTILPPYLICTLAEAIKAAVPPASPFEFSVEVDPTLFDAEKVAALQSVGMTCASIGIQDFDPKVQAAIGRKQTFAATRRCVETLRKAGGVSLNVDLVYGLPHQTREVVAASLRQVLSLEPDRIALFGYAHVPWMAKRQELIDEAHLPDDRLRHSLFVECAETIVGKGYAAIGIDHFAKSADALSEALRRGTLRRNFQGYTADACQTLIGIGASAISRFPQGYVQNAVATGAYMQRIDSGSLAGYRGHALTQDDKLRARAIEMLMCQFRIDLNSLLSEFGALARTLNPIHDLIVARYSPYITRTADCIAIDSSGAALTRMVAAGYDAYTPAGVVYSRAT
ncbi:oxygen-independent coproporphyrinogen III oxidase [Silicimonas algicola]|uniref:Coproporphyrinogen-III oxidase n=1 Tax=Silicimonas algicola TaxID=1826607 RepID=A0A316G5S8_9RHOB|nr:oxygen-independent coproporphyrinogen III oxidase [Silicimonas algicola]AZQ66944.1 oxygen-independent coproporphyrinogen III oxidase [Silicimonas algicola]PWK55140.1 oxygen-independent coproporphyrinogen-3 oxidase [Silicimonas algicola]